MKKINGDRPGGILNRILYFYQCLRDQKKGKLYNNEIYSPKISINNISTFKKTPSRLLCDGFWNSINYENLKFQLNDKLNIFDIGCGSGNYGTFLKNLSHKSFSSYTGLDIYKHSSYPLEFKHVKDKAENVAKYLTKEINFVISQSALEHIENDILVIEEITKKLNEHKKPFIQVHMIPASKCLWLYLWHGYRQYSHKNLSGILNNLNNNFNLNSCIIPIGGSYSFWVHLRHITLPVYLNYLIFRDKFFKWYKHQFIEKKIFQTASKELHCINRSPLFWCLIITSKNIKIKDNLLKKF